MVRALSNEEFGRQVGISHSLASRLRTGTCRPSLELVGRISARLDIPLGDLAAACLEGGSQQAELLAAVAPRRRPGRVVGEASDREAEGSADQDAPQPIPDRVTTSPTTEALD